MAFSGLKAGPSGVPFMVDSHSVKRFLLRSGTSGSAGPKIPTVYARFTSADPA